jgi:hypothetical protein
MSTTPTDSEALAEVVRRFVVLGAAGSVVGDEGAADEGAGDTGESDDGDDGAADDGDVAGRAVTGGDAGTLLDAVGTDRAGGRVVVGALDRPSWARQATAVDPPTRAATTKATAKANRDRRRRGGGGLERRDGPSGVIRVVGSGGPQGAAEPEAQIDKSEASSGSVGKVSVTVAGSSTGVCSAPVNAAAVRVW